MASEAKRKYDREYHAGRTPEAKAHKNELQRARAVRNLKALRELKTGAGCADCHEKDPIVLEFDHRDRTAKRFDLGDATRLGMSLTKLLDEAAKCDVVCANCHRRRTAKQMKWA